MNDIELSQYIKTLRPVDQAEYGLKIKSLGLDRDTYLIHDSLWLSERNAILIVPNLSWPKIFHYFQHLKSPFSGATLEIQRDVVTGVEKSLENGWITSFRSLKLSNTNILLSAKVCPSQTLNSKPYLPWLCLSQDGFILFGHCTCPSGLGQMCSHIATLANAALQASDMQSKKSCTEDKCPWLPGWMGTTYSRPELFHRPIVQFGKQLKRSPVKVRLPSEEDKKRVMERLAGLNGPPSGILLVLPGHAVNYVPEPIRNPPPPSLKTLYQKELAGKPLKDIIKESSSIIPTLVLTEQQITTIEQLTRQQRQSLHWPKYRAGRITGSTISKALRTDIDKPAYSTIAEICYPYQPKKSKSKSLQSKIPEPLQWGIAKEAKALAEFAALIEGENEHGDFEIKEAGLFVSERFPFLAASPDGIFICPCHGKSCIEIKCPWSHREKTVEEAACSDPNFPLKLPNESQSYVMSKKHDYYLQIQLQMFVTNTSRCFFVIYTKLELVTVLVEFDELFFRSKIQSAQLFWEKCIILPELIAAHFTNVKKRLQCNDKENSFLPCFCQEEKEDEQVISCADPSCVRKVFHVSCVRKFLKRIPKQWKCDLCKKAEAKRKREDKKLKPIQNIQSCSVCNSSHLT